VTVVLATRNRRKIDELERILVGPRVAVRTLEDFPGCPEVREEGTTFEANAATKALAVARYTGQPALADDSGLEVEALGGAPGVRSARYAGEEADDQANVAKLLEALREVPDGARRARFVCVVALALPDGRVETFRGTVEGSVGREPRGSAGFGYDPVFYPLGERRTFAEMRDDEKDAVSHRGRALRAARRRLTEGRPGEESA